MGEQVRQAALEDSAARTAAQPWSAVENSTEDPVEDSAEDSAKEPAPDRTGMFTSAIVATGSRSRCSPVDASTLRKT
jgi:hypothetical protein